MRRLLGSLLTPLPSPLPGSPVLGVPTAPDPARVGPPLEGFLWSWGQPLQGLHRPHLPEETQPSLLAFPYRFSYRKVATSESRTPYPCGLSLALPERVQTGAFVLEAAFMLGVVTATGTPPNKQTTKTTQELEPCKTPWQVCSGVPGLPCVTTVAHSILWCGGTTLPRMPASCLAWMPQARPYKVRVHII